MVGIVCQSCIESKKEWCKCPGCGDGGLRHAYHSCPKLRDGKKGHHDFCFVCSERWKCSMCGRQVNGGEPMVTPPLSSLCPSCASSHVREQQPSSLEVEVVEAVQARDSRIMNLYLAQEPVEESPKKSAAPK